MIIPKIEHIRLSIARILNHHPNVCWCDLVGWALGTTEYTKHSLRRDVAWDGRCKEPPHFDPRLGGCYCGKFRIEDEDGTSREGPGDNSMPDICGYQSRHNYSGDIRNSKNYSIGTR